MSTKSFSDLNMERPNPDQRHREMPSPLGHNICRSPSSGSSRGQRGAERQRKPREDNIKNWTGHTLMSLARGSGRQRRAKSTDGALYLHGTDGVIYLHGTDGVIYLHGTDGAIYLHGTDGALYLHGTDGAIYLHGTDGAIYLHGTDGAIYLHGTDGALYLHGTDGAIYLHGTDGVIYLHGISNTSGLGISV